MSILQKQNIKFEESHRSSEIGKEILSAVRYTNPFQYWTVRNLIPTDLLNDLCLIQNSRKIQYRCNGFRDGTNGRIPITSEEIAKNTVFSKVANLFSDKLILQNLNNLTNKSIQGSRLRMSLCIDQNGFWLKPHTDMSIKLMTIIIYLNQSQKTENLGTDLYNSIGDVICSIPSQANNALIFIPGKNTYHGFERKIITGERRTLIINYVNKEWHDVNDLTGLAIDYF